MKKLILSTAILLGSLSTFANTTIAPTVVSASGVMLQEEFTEVAVDAVPNAVKTAVETAMPGAIIEKAYTNEKKEYKLEIKTMDGNVTIVTDASGTIL